MKRIVLTLCVIISLSTVSDAEYYKCVTSSGKTIFTDSPPPDAKCEFKERSNSFSESTQTDINPVNKALNGQEKKTVTFSDDIEKKKEKIADQEAARIEIDYKIRKLREDGVNSAKMFDELRRKTRQSTMTEIEKYYDDVKAAEAAINKVKQTGRKEDFDDALIKVNALPDKAIKSK